jgi:hypothetical protein
MEPNRAVEGVLDGLALGLKRYVAGLFEVYLSDLSTTERLERGLERAVKGYGEAVRVAEDILGKTLLTDDQET